MIDGEDNGTGTEIAKKYSIFIYPTYLILSADCFKEGDATVYCHCNCSGSIVSKSTLGTLYCNEIIFCYINRNTCGYGNGSSTNS